MYYGFLPSTQTHVKPVYDILTLNVICRRSQVIGTRKEYIRRLYDIYLPTQVEVYRGKVYFFGNRSGYLYKGRFEGIDFYREVLYAKFLPDDRILICGPGYYGFFDSDFNPTNVVEDWCIPNSIRNYGSNFVIASNNGVVAVVDRNMNTLFYVVAPEMNIISATAYGSYIYAASRRKVYKIDLAGNVVATYQHVDSINNINVDSSGNLILACEDGVYLLDSDLNVINSFDVALPCNDACEQGGYIFAYDAATLYLRKIDPSTGNDVTSIYLPNVSYINATDDGNIVLSYIDNGNYVIAVYDTNLNLVWSDDSTTNPYLLYATCPVKVPGENTIIFALRAYAMIGEEDMTSKTVTALYAGLLPYSIESNGIHVAITYPLHGLVEIADMDLNTITYLTDAYQPSCAIYYKGKLYVADNYTGYVFVYSVPDYTLESFFIPAGFTYPILRFKVRDGLFLSTDGYSVIAYDENFNIVKKFQPSTRLQSIFVDKKGDELYVALNYDNTILIMDYDTGEVEMRFQIFSGLAAGVVRYNVSHTGGYVAVVPGYGIVFMRDYYFERQLLDANLLSMSYNYDGRGFVVGRYWWDTRFTEYDEQLNVVNEVSYPYMFTVTSIVKLRDGKYILTDMVYHYLLCYDSDGNLLWGYTFPGNHYPKVAPDHNYEGVWVYNLNGLLLYCDSDGNLTTVISKSNWKAKGVYDDGYKLYIATHDGYLEEYDYDGNLLNRFIYEPYIYDLYGRRINPNEPLTVFY